MIETFPEKQPLSVQTDNFAERRSRALDAYVQILLYALRTTNPNAKLMRSVKQFFNFNTGSSNEQKQTKSEASIVRTPNFINSEIERLRKRLAINEPINETDFKELQGQVYDLQEKRKGKGSEDDLRCVEKFYELKREWEIRKIRSGTFDTNEFNIDKRTGNKTEIATARAADLSSTSKAGCPVIKDELILQNAKRHLFDQEAMLADLSETLSKQKLLSKEIHSEVIEQNRLLGRVGEQQEIVAEDFKGSNSRVKKLQDK